MNSSNLSPLQTSILATLAYHDLLDMPLTATEVWRFRVRPFAGRTLMSESLSEVDAALRDLVADKILETHYGYFFFPGKKHFVEKRLKHHTLSQMKWRRLRRVAFFMQIIPFLRMAAASGSLAREAAREESDLDVLIVTAPGRIWTARFLVTVALDLLGLRRRPTGATKNLVCLNHYLSQNSLRLPYESIYTALEYARIVPLFGWPVFKNFRLANKEWMEKYLTQVFPDDEPNLKMVPDFFLFNWIRSSVEFVLGGGMGDLLEKFLGNIQQKRIERGRNGEFRIPNPEFRNGRDGSLVGRVVASSIHLEFHPQSKEAPLIRQFNQRMREMGLDEFGNQKDSGLS